jgi:FkbM family methyltransferase
MNIPAIFEPMPLWLRRHSLLNAFLKVFPDSHDQLIEFNSRARAYVDLRDPEVRNVFLKRSFEPEFFRIAESVLASGGVYFDCGANFGLRTFGLLRSIDHVNLECHLFEANARLINYLERSKRLYPSLQINVVEGCLSDRRGHTRFHISRQNSGHSHVHPEGSSLTQNIVLDDYLEANKIQNINFLKLDIEGQELNALRGLSSALNRQIVEIIYLEVATDVLDRYRLAPEDVTRFLESNGFRVFYCREKDISGDCSTTVRFNRDNLNQLRLIEFKPRKGNLRTDLLAIHEALIERNRQKV